MIEQILNFLTQESFPVAFVAVVLVVAYASKQLHPLIQLKIQNEKNKDLQHTLLIADNLAASAIVEVAKLVELTGPQRKLEAINFITEKLNERGHHLDDDTVSAIVEKAYQVQAGISPSKGDA